MHHQEVVHDVSHPNVLHEVVHVVMVEHWRHEVDPKVVFQNVHHLLEDVGNGVSKSLCESPHVVGVFHLCAMMMVHVVSEYDENHVEDSVDTFDVMGK